MLIAKRILERAKKAGIPQEDVIIDCLAMMLATESQAAAVTLKTIRKVHLELSVNQTLGASNVSFELPERDTLNSIFSALTICAGVFPIFVS
jgi:5-methyltetrahydrofolate--homocysteine methyltransferase